MAVQGCNPGLLTLSAGWRSLLGEDPRADPWTALSLPFSLPRPCTRTVTCAQPTGAASPGLLGCRWAQGGQQGSPWQGHGQEDCHRSTEAKGPPGICPSEAPLEQCQDSHT